MPAIVQRQGKRWIVRSHRGAGAKTLGTHRSEAKARAQQRAVNASLKRKRKL